MLNTSKFFKMFLNAINSLTSHLKRSRALLTTNEDEIIDSLLNSEEDKIRFQKEVEDLIKSNKTSKNVDINGKRFTISV